MHPAISQFPSAWFYESRLKDGVQEQDKPIPIGLAWPAPGIPIAFVEVGRPMSRDWAREGASRLASAYRLAWPSLCFAKLGSL